MRKVILLADAGSEYARGLLEGISEYSRLHGPWIFQRESMAPFYRETTKRKILDRLKNWNADGIIARISGLSIVQEITKLNLPMVTTDDDDQFLNVPCVVSGYKATGFMAAEHLLNIGHQRFAFCGFDKYKWSKKRCEFFCKRIEKAGFNVIIYPYPKSKSKQFWEKEQISIIEWLKSLPRPIGIMASNDDRGQQILECCKIAGIYVPEEISVIGVDNDILLCGLSNPPLSSIAIDTVKAGYKISRILDRLMKGQTIREQSVQAHATHVEIRQSTNTLVIEDPYVIEALQYIRNNFKKPIQVTDVANTVTVSRRTMSKKFYKTIGRTIHEEIKRARIEHICNLLTQTTLSLYQIAEELNFTGAEHISRYFRDQKGMTPLSYRKHSTPLKKV